MRSLGRRLTELENVAAPLSERWHWIIRDRQTYEAAVADYEAENGPIVAGENIICWKIVDPREAA